MKLRIKLGAPLPSLANARLHWRKRASIVQAQRHLVSMTLKAFGGKPPPLPVLVTFYRVAPRKLDSDNNVTACKTPRDAVAAWLGADDRPGSGIEWAYQQRSDGPRVFALEIEIQPMETT